MNSAAPKILFVTQDAGGFNAVYPVYKAVKEQDPECARGLFSDVAKQIANDKSLFFVDASQTKKEDIERVFDTFHPDALVVGTSSGLSMEKLATQIARERSIPSVAIMDFWSNYKLRFSHPGTEDMAFLPDRIFVMDELCKNEMVQEGFDAGRIVITGNPYFETFKNPPSDQGGDIISFFSQPFSELKDEEKGLDFGFDEREVFHDVINALEKLGVEEEIVVKLHPRTKHLGVFDETIGHAKLSIRIDSDMTAEETIARSRAVIGMNSTILFVAALFGKPVLSYQPNLNRPDPLVNNRIGLSTGVYRKEELLPALNSLLSSGPTLAADELRKRYVDGQAVQNVLRAIQSLL